MQNITGFKHIDVSDVRNAMLDEVELDITSNLIYISPRLKVDTRLQYLELLKGAVADEDDKWLATNVGKLIKLLEWRGSRQVRVPKTASITLAEGQFNLYYMRGLCIYAIDNMVNMLQISRFKTVDKPRSSSVSVLNSLVSPIDTLNELRRPFEERISPLAKPNSGLTLCIPN